MSYREDADIYIPHGKFHASKSWQKVHLDESIHKFAVKNRHIAQKSQVNQISMYLTWETKIVDI